MEYDSEFYKSIQNIFKILEEEGKIKNENEY